ncbi:LPS assembly protein LptD [Arsenophonus symbiont of Ornithomya chloropus]|uniref:LPS assembly protein LptD n=1 Tax=Arsenophonus symbiont of Ornithomya chloropus TaxID=634121 RepID=UPI0032B23C34
MKKLRKKIIKNNYFIVIISIMYITIYSQQSQANLKKQCAIQQHVNNQSTIEDNPINMPIYITAKKITSSYPNFIEYKGNVNIQQGNQKLIADKIQLKQKNINKKILRTIIATGNVNYDDSQIILRGEKARVNLDNKDADFEKSNYFMVGRQGHGYANKIQLRKNNRYTILEKGTFTSCPKKRENWNLMGSKIVVDREEQILKIKHASFLIANVPIFYSPYLILPIGNKRRTGFLLPNITYSTKSGLNFKIPFYWNIASNYDLTITPKFITSHEIDINNELRYLTNFGTGTVKVDWFKKNNNNQKNPWIFHWQHSGIFQNTWQLDFEYKKNNDLRNFISVSDKYKKNFIDYLNQKFSISYKQPNLDTTFTYKHFQIIDDLVKNKYYYTAPQLDLHYYQYNLGPVSFNTYAQATYITNSADHNPNTIRLHIEPELNIPLSNNFIKINNSIKIMATYYNQDIPFNLNNNNLPKHVTRILPAISSDAKVIFKRNLLMNKYYMQTLEPRIQYSYIPYRDQSNINNYDSTLLETDYYSLFRKKIYTGLDRINASNQLTAGITTRIYNEKFIERFNFSIGQKYFLKSSKIEDFNSKINNKDNIGSILWAGNAYFQLTNHWKLYGSLQYDRRFNNIARGNISTEYQIDKNHLMQLNYRFVDPQHIESTYKNILNLQNGISQIGAIITWPLGYHWKFISSYYFSIKDNQPINQLIGLEYNTCCWSMTIGYERKITDWKKQKSMNDYDNQLSFNLELRGLNNNDFNIQDILSNSIIPYQPIF